MFLSLSVEYLRGSAPIRLQVGRRRHKAGEKVKHSHFSAFVLNSLTLPAFEAFHLDLIFRFWHRQA